MCNLFGGGKKQSKPAQQVLPAQQVAAQPVGSSANVKNAVKNDDKDRGSGADLRSDLDVIAPGGEVPTNLPEAGGVPLGANKKRKKVVGLDL